MSHLEVAAKSGMKAGFKAYMTTLKRSRLPEVRATLDTLNAMSSRQAFAFYCAKHGPDVTAIVDAIVEQPTRKRTTRQAEPEAPAGLAAEIAEARARLAELEKQAKAESAPKRKRTSAKAEVKENLWREWAVRKNNIPTKVGATFTYKGKRRTTTFQVTRVTSEGVYSKRVS